LIKWFSDLFLGDKRLYPFLFKEALRAVEKANKTGKVTLVKDVDIKVFDHATGKIGTLTVGISVPPGSEDYIKELRKTHNVPDFI